MNSVAKWELKKKILNGRNETVCCFCEKPLHILDRQNLTLEHIIPLCFGGSWKLNNLTLSCWECNHDRGCAAFHLYKAWKLGELKEKPKTNFSWRERRNMKKRRHII